MHLTISLGNVNVTYYLKCYKLIKMLVLGFAPTACAFVAIASVRWLLEKEKRN